MKTITKMFAVAALVLAASAARAEKASYLYWQIDPAVDVKYTFSYAMLRASDSTYLTVGGQSGNKFYAGDSESATGTSIEPTWATITGYTTGSTFLLELYNASDTLVGQYKTAVAYAALTSYISGDWEHEPVAAPFSFDGGEVVPEPCTGLLGLLGFGLIGLRKKFKKAKKA